mgnify:CR=1 FL=1
MIRKFRDDFQTVETLAALLRYLPKGHEKIPKVEADYNKYNSGLRGEQNVDYYLSGLPKQDYHIYRSLRIRYEKYAFQIDTLLITDRYIMPIETKNHTGIIEIDEQNQFYQIAYDSKAKISSPLHQVNRHVYELQRWLTRRHLPQLPFKWLVCFSNPTTTIRNLSSDSTIQERVVNIENLIDYVKKLTETMTLKASKNLNKNDIEKINFHLLSDHSTLTSSVLENYGIKLRELETGVQCPSCKKLAMVYKSKKWHCPHCGETSTDAHIQAIKDYLLIFKPSITIKEGCDFLHIQSSNIVRRLFSSMNLVGTGNTNARSYKLPK